MSKTTKTIIGIVVLVIVLIGIYYFVGKKSGTQPANKEVIKIGAVLPLTGKSAVVGILLKEGLEWKIEELKKKGVPVEFYLEDTQSDNNQAITAFQNLVNNKGIKVIFTVSSPHGMALKPLAEQYKVLLWADSAHPDQTKNSQYVLRHSNVADNDAKILYDFAKTRNYKKVGILYQQDDWGVVWNNIMSEFLKQDKIEVISEAIDPKSSDFRSQITKILSKEPDAVFIISVGAAGGYLIKQVKELNYNKDLYTANGFVLSPDAQTIAGDYAKGMYYLDYNRNPQFEKDYEEKFGKKQSGIEFIGYTDIELLYYAVTQKKSTEPEQIISFIKNLKEFEGKYEKVLIQPNGDLLMLTNVKVWGQ